MEKSVKSRVAAAAMLVMRFRKGGYDERIKRKDELATAEFAWLCKKLGEGVEDLVHVGAAEGLNGGQQSSYLSKARRKV